MQNTPNSSKRAGSSLKTRLYPARGARIRFSWYAQAASCAAAGSALSIPADSQAALSMVSAVRRRCAAMRLERAVAYSNILAGTGLVF